ncbi:TIGR02679 domain-containing protein [Fusicatenibacter saccharivorans]|uniref:TIGR02679 domain-containing protein n=1 Tax=Fusicatenibacter saccharivorans TaxID=1150298 RepID=UPI003D001A1E
MKKRWNNGLSSSLTRECADYFRERPVFDRLLRGFREKYMSYGSFSGTVTVRNLSEEDIEDLEGFFQKNFHGQKSVSISAARFEKALKNSRFDGCQPKEILEQYFGEEMAGKKELQKEEEQKWFLELEHAKRSCIGTLAQQWVDELIQKKSETSLYLAKRYRESGKNIEEVRALLHLGIRILNAFPYHQEKTEYLAVFAAMMTGNPHAFDDGMKDGQFLRLLAEWDTAHRGLNVEKSELFPALQKQRIYLAVGILRDDVSNCVMLSGIRAWNRNGEVHAGMEGFRDEGDPVQVPLAVLAGWERVECPAQEIYIVENPSVYAMLCGTWRGRKACMCMNGQPRLSAVMMLDLLKKAESKVYYAGDFDPEGMLIAQKIRHYYKGEMEYWHMSAKDYEKSRSQERISERRLKMLDRIEDTELVELADAIRKEGVAGYQESIWEVYLDGVDPCEAYRKCFCSRYSVGVKL